nr:uncharacterized protein LOC109169584 [Ipomoea trifida]
MPQQSLLPDSSITALKKLCSHPKVIERDPNGERIRVLAEGPNDEPPLNTSLILASKRIYRKDHLNHFERYTGGWNINNWHYYAGHFVTTLEKNLKGFHYAKMAKVVGVCEALKCLKSLGVEEALIESDALLVIEGTRSVD